MVAKTPLVSGLAAIAGYWGSKRMPRLGPLAPKWADVVLGALAIGAAAYRVDGAMVDDALMGAGLGLIIGAFV